MHVRSIPLLEMPDPEARKGLQRAIEKGDVIGLYTQHVTGQVTIELNHFGPRRLKEAWEEFRMTCAEWTAYYYANKALRGWDEAA